MSAKNLEKQKEILEALERNNRIVNYFGQSVTELLDSFERFSTIFVKVLKEINEAKDALKEQK